jgi:zinc transporter
MTHAIADDEGLVCAFKLAPPAACDEAILKQDPIAESSLPLWLHFNLNDARARRWLQGHEALSLDAREALLGTDSRIHAEVLPEGGFIALLGDLDHKFHGEPEGLHTLRIYVDDKRMISARRHPLRGVDQLRKELLAGAVEAQTPLGLFEHYIECLATTMSALVSKLGEEVDDAEEQILSDHLSNRGNSLGRIRRLLARLRRHLHANRAALAPLPSRLPLAHTAAQKQGLRQVIERLDAVAQDLELVQERARLLQEEIAARLGEATNRNLFVLSIVTTILLPITLVTGVFGMNVGGLPWLESRKGFLWVMLLMVAALILILWLLRRRRIL